MRLWIVQHGDALAKDVDPNRPLSEKGRSDVEKLASHLAGCGCSPSGEVGHLGDLG